MNLPTVFARDLAGTWHIAKETYAAAADTLCGLRQYPCRTFTTDPYTAVSGCKDCIQLAETLSSAGG